MATACCEALRRALQFCSELEQLSGELGIATGWIEIIFREGRPFRVELFVRGVSAEETETFLPEGAAAERSLAAIRRRLLTFALQRAKHCTIAFGSMTIRLYEDRIREIEIRQLYKVHREEIERKRLARVFAA